ncbi:hypothetical protein SDC9_164220 [bioreactor metagenome]|uniref:Uncharacterized protein n=1 Tax=bioreactor metagenome TaxID=1076179 RepID=A0A645FY89_9ZZZZ
MPVSSQSNATHSHEVSAITGNTVSILFPSMDTEFIIPGLLQYFIASTHALTLGLSTDIGKSVTS